MGRAAAPPVRSGADEVAGLSSAAFISRYSGGASHGSSRSSTSSHHSSRTRRALGTVRWYNGRRRLGYVIPDDGKGDLFIPAQGAVNGSVVPPQPGGLFHGTRVSFLPMALKPSSEDGQA